MAPLREELRPALAAALEKRRRDDTVEMAVGREMRRMGLGYQDYLEAMEAVRETARRRGLPPWKAVEAVTASYAALGGPRPQPFGEADKLLIRSARSLSRE